MVLDVLLNFESLSCFPVNHGDRLDRSPHCLLRSAARGFDVIDYNMPIRPVYRVITPSQNRNRCFGWAIQHSLLPAPALHAPSAFRLAMLRRGACTHHK
jgi:hypothetical protein